MNFQLIVHYSCVHYMSGFWSIQNLFNPPPLGTFSFRTDNDIIRGSSRAFSGSCCTRIENGCFRSVSGVFCVSFGLSFRPSFSIRRWGCSSSYHRPHFWYYGNMCLSRSVCKKAARSMTCHLKSNSFWTERGSGFWEFIVDIFTSYIWNSIPSAFLIWLSFIFLVETVPRTFCFYFDVGNSVFGRIDHPLDK